jgi:hypothetical protein
LQLLDLDQDSYLDVVSTDFEGNRLSYFAGQVGGSFAQAIDLPVSGSFAGPIDIDAADVNLDGNADLVVTEHFAHRISFLLGEGNGAFALSATILTTDDFPRSVTVADFTNDGRLDLSVVSETEGTLQVWVKRCLIRSTATMER